MFWSVVWSLLVCFSFDVCVFLSSFSFLSFLSLLRSSNQDFVIVILVVIVIVIVIAFVVVIVIVIVVFVVFVVVVRGGTDKNFEKKNLKNKCLKQGFHRYEDAE